MAGFVMIVITQRMLQFTMVPVNRLGQAFHPISEAFIAGSKFCQRVSASANNRQKYADHRRNRQNAGSVQNALPPVELTLAS